MKILILGNGAREQVIYEKLHLSINSSSINHTVYLFNELDFAKIINLCIEKNIDLVIPSTEDFLCQGIVDHLNNTLPNIKVFGPTKYQSHIEGSKQFSKSLMHSLNIPTTTYIYCSTMKSLYHNNQNSNPYMFNYLPVLKYSGLAKGKGVYLPNTQAEIQKNIIDLFKLGNDGIIIEKRLYGTEVSLLAFCNGKEAILMPQAQDYKRVYDKDNGPNTGGMGAICPANILSPEELVTAKDHMDKIVKYLNYKGILYAGLMKTLDNVYFLEFNCRFGDPEAQVILNLLDDDLCNIIMKCINEEDLQINWSTKNAAVVILAHEDYPKNKLNELIKIQYDNLDKTVKIYESNVKYIDNKSYTTGGRVLSMVSIDKTIPLALQNIYNNMPKISFPGAFYRRDIGCNNNLSYKKMSISIGVLASGNGTCLDDLLNHSPEYIAIIITNKSTAEIAKKAYAHNIPFFYIPQKSESMTEYYEKIVNILRLYNIELVLLAGYMKIVPNILFDEFHTINIHPSLLPKYGGLMDMAVHEAVITNKEQFSGCTLHKVSKDVDKGRILLQKQYKIQKDDTPKSLKQNIQELEKQCILEYINSYNLLNPSVTYTVDIAQSNEFIDNLKTIIPKLGGFCAEYEYKGLRLAASADGCGTKLDLANTYDKLDTIGIDLVAMNVNDLIAGGAIPLFFMDYIAVDKMDKDKCNKIIAGINKGCLLSNCKLIGGETAEMQGTYLKNKCDLAGFVIGEVKFDLPKKDKMVDGCVIYGLKSSGIHSNGYTLVRKLLQKSVNAPSIEDILEPTCIYTNVSKLWELFPNNILGIAHITGGGFRDNIVRILPDHLDFHLDEWEIPPIFQWIQRESNMTRAEMMATLNCGYGMIIICDKELDIIGDLEDGRNLQNTLLSKYKLQLDLIGKVIIK